MGFDLFSKRVDAHVRKAQEYLQAANLSHIEHRLAAEHHSALALMYAQRVAWLEQELSDPDVQSESVARFPPPLRGITSSQGDAAKRGAESLMSLA